MEKESFENYDIAKILNDNFISIKVDKEERPDIDSIYMRVCQAFTGGGGWPTSIFMTAEQKPFFAGTYYPPDSFVNILDVIKQNWDENRSKFIKNSNDAVEFLKNSANKAAKPDDDLSKSAFSIFYSSFDKVYGGFDDAPKFPTPHNLMFLLKYYENTKDKSALEMAEKTLLQMYKGGIFDHIGYGFSRYSTDRYWLAPHFEKMLYDNALLSMTYLLAFECTNNELYKSAAQKIFKYVNTELTDSQGGFYSAQDADSDGVEGKYYVFTPNEIINILGQPDGELFNKYYDITQAGNFEGKSIPNLIHQAPPFKSFDELLPKLYEYRKHRNSLHKDNKILTSWNSLMIWSYANAYRILHDNTYLLAAEKAAEFIIANLLDDTTLYVGMTDKTRSGKGFIDDYAFFILALISLYQASFNNMYLELAIKLNNKVIENYFDNDNGGFYLYGEENEQLILKPKESYDGAIPSGNSVMSYNLSTLYKMTKDEKLFSLSDKQSKFMKSEANNYPAGHSFFLCSTFPTVDIICVLKDKSDINEIKIKSNWVMRVVDSPSKEYPLINDKTTFYICEGNMCLPPTNELRK